MPSNISIDEDKNISIAVDNNLDINFNSNVLSVEYDENQEDIPYFRPASIAITFNKNDIKCKINDTTNNKNTYIIGANNLQNGSLIACILCYNAGGSLSVSFPIENPEDDNYECNYSPSAIEAYELSSLSIYSLAGGDAIHCSTPIFFIVRTD